MAEPDLRSAIARAVSDRSISDDAINEVAGKLDYGQPIRRFSPCIYGICTDFFVERPAIDELLKNALEFGPVGEIRCFPYGIPPLIDLYHVQIEQRIDALEP